MRLAKSWFLDIGIMIILFSLMYLTILGHRPLFVPDEGRYAEIAREMAESNDFITPTLNYIKYFEKPPLFYWLSATSIKLFGVSISSVRLINGLLSILGCLALYLVGRISYGRTAGWLSALVLATSGLFFVMGHTVSLDLPVTVFLSMTLLLLLLAVQNGRHTNYLLYGAALFAALALLTKGLIGLLLPSIILFVYLLIKRDFGLLKTSHFWIASLFFLILALPWHILVSIRNPEFLHFYIIEQHILRYSQVGIGHYQPSWFFIPWVILGFFPWVIFFWDALRFHLTRIKRDNMTLFLLCWVAVIFLFFSFSKSKLIPYILPLFPALSLLIGSYLAEVKKISKLSLALLGGFIIVFTFVFTYYLRSTILPNTFYASIIFILACSLLWVGWFVCCYFRSIKMVLLVTITVTGGFFWFSLIVATPALDTRTVLPFAKKLIPLLKPQDEVINVNLYYQDLPFYLQRKITIVNWQNELTFGMNHQQAPWMIKEADLVNKINQPLHHKRYILMSKEDWLAFNEKHKGSFKVIDETINDVMIMQ